MQIGEFAKLCGTRISVLRHYDKCGLLVPVHTDKLTGYRYYAPGQAKIFQQITSLKDAGFSLSEIRTLLCGKDTALLFAAKRIELLEMLQNLQEAEKLMSGGTKMEKRVIITENIDLPFVNDEAVIGKWKILGVYAEKEDFYLEKPAGDYEIKEFYFLPEGER
ncbi:MAG: MerR family transcriptional regulator [Oscillospiraceae bacterium]|nr:MerR family transcriptional regulator [Oscillospiraceae bacterium]